MKSEIEGVVSADHPDVDRALAKDPVVIEQPLDVVEHFGKARHPGTDVVGKASWQVALNAAGAEVLGMHPRARHPLVELHQLLALLEPPQERRHRANVERHGGDVEEVVHDPGNLGEQHPDVFRALGNLELQQVLDRQDVRVLLAHHRDVIETIEIADALEIGAVFDQFLGATVEQPDVRVGALDHLAVELEDEPQHPVGRRMLRPKVHGIVLE